MAYFYLTKNLAVTEITDSRPAECARWWWKPESAGWATRHDFETLELAQKVADSASELTGEAYVATDAGDQCSPRYDVIRAPAIGDEVSYGFNGDCYPCGTVVKVSKSLKRVETSEGKVFNRRKQTGGWMQQSWSLVNGHHYAQNPHF